MACPPYCDVFQQLAAWAPAMKGMLAGFAAGSVAGGAAVAAVGGGAAAGGALRLAPGAGAGAAAAGRIANGDFERTFETAAGSIRVFAEVASKGKTLVMNNLLVYPDNAERLQAGAGAVRAGFRAIEQMARSAGYDQLIVNYSRTTGANPGRIAQKIIELHR